MILTLHGTGAGAPNGDRMASALSATFNDGSVVLFDCGEAASRSMLRDGVDPTRVASVLISHFHPDHWTGLPQLCIALEISKRTAPLFVHHPPGSEPFLRNVLLHSHLFLEELPFVVNFRAVAPGMLATVTLPDGWSAEFFPTTHFARSAERARRHGLPDTAYGYLLRNGGRRVVLSQDIGSENDLVEVMEGAELLVCESAHINAENLLALASERGVKRVVFTHVPPTGASFPESFEGIEWSVASDGERIELR